MESALMRVLARRDATLKSRDLDELVARELQITPEQNAIIHSGSRTEFSYRMAWIRTKAKKKGLIERDESSGAWRKVASS
jgi:hypothetical protein